MKYWYDTEFLEDGHFIELISIGIVAEDGREFYAVNGSMDQQRVQAHEWLRGNVWPFLPAKLYRGGPETVLDIHSHELVLPKIEIAYKLNSFFENDNEIELWAYYCAYDHVCLQQIFGPMPNQKLLPWYTNELMQLWKEAGKPEKPPEPENVHHALEDARWNKKLYDTCEKEIKSWGVTVNDITGD